MSLIKELLEELITKGGSDLHLKIGQKPILRIKGSLARMERPELSEPDLRLILEEMLTPPLVKKLDDNRELDFSYSLENRARFRVNAFFQKNQLGFVLRIIPKNIPSLDQLGHPPVLKELVTKHQGLVLVTGPTGSGKSTTLAAMINQINETDPSHIITIEDPIEFVHEDKTALINQREIGFDTFSFYEALKRALRQDPDIILVGEMRDPETISMAITAAETGHLVFSTLHTNDAKQSIDRILDTFPPEQQHQVRMQLATVLVAIVSQRLVLKIDGSGRAAAMEIMINSPTIKKLVEESKIGEITKAIEDSGDFYHMQSFNQSLLKLWKDKVISEPEALAVSVNPNDLKLKMQIQSFGVSAAPAPGTKPAPESPSPFGGKKW